MKKPNHKHKKDKNDEIKCICEPLGGRWLAGNSDCPVHYPKFEHRYCEYCGEKCVFEFRDKEFDVYTGKQKEWVICPRRTVKYNNSLGMNKLADSELEKHSRWVKELVTSS